MSSFSMLRQVAKSGFQKQEADTKFQDNAPPKGKKAIPPKRRRLQDVDVNKQC